MKIKVFHILVKHQFEAEDIAKRITDFESFKEQARKYSLCPSSQNQGDLGEVQASRLDEDFLEAFELLKVGCFSKPVRTRFGWHLIYRP